MGRGGGGDAKENMISIRWDGLHGGCCFSWWLCYNDLGLDESVFEVPGLSFIFCFRMLLSIYVGCS